MRRTECLKEGWKFHLETAEEGGRNFADPAFDDSAWKDVTLPHDWSNDVPLSKEARSGGGGGYAAGGRGWYRLTFEAPADFRKRRNVLLFEGVYMDAAIYLNGERIGRNGYGYSSFVVSLDGALKEGQNTLAVLVDNSREPNSRWYSGSGIYRDVFFLQTERVHIAEFGVRAATNGIYPKQDMAKLEIRSFLINESGQDANAGILYELKDAEGNTVATSGTALFLAAGETGDTMVLPEVLHPHLWSVDDPYLYTLVCTAVVDGKPVDRVSRRIGIRTADFDKDKGFLLNGTPVKIKGMCVHHDGGLTGAAFYRETWERRLRKLKDMGCNGIRFAHNPPAPAMLDLCDELGFLVMDEVLDEWMLTKNKIDNYYSQNFAYGASQYYSSHAEEELTHMIRRDYCHPSVILWSIGNEIPEQCALDGPRMAAELASVCHREDASRKVTSACDNIAAVEPIRTLRAFENALDVVGYNYVGRWRERAETFFEEDRALFPERCFIGSENPSFGGSRGRYDTEGFWDYVSGSLHHEALWRYEKAHDFVAGDYLWTGVDYLGETRWPSRGAACGPLDTAGFEKDSFWYFRSIWNEKDVSLHLAPDWNLPGREGEFVTVVCYTNCEEAKLYLNGKYVGRGAMQCPRYGCTKAWNDRPAVAPTTNDLHLTWTVPYEPGELKVIGLIGGKPAAEYITRTVGAPAQLRAEVWKPEGTDGSEDSAVSMAAVQAAQAALASEAATPEAEPAKYLPVIPVRGLAQIAVSAVDEGGAFTEHAVGAVHCTVEGPARLLGMDGGDLEDLTLYENPVRKLHAGRLLAAVRPYAAGKVTVTFTSEGLAPATVTFEAAEDIQS